VALDRRRAVQVRDVLGEFLEGMPELKVVHYGDPRDDLDPPAAIIEFNFPDTLREATSGYQELGWVFDTTFTFDATDWEEADTEWCLLAVALLNAIRTERHLGTNFIQKWSMEDIAPPESIAGARRSKPVMFKAVRFILETEEH
jgi:hypothetical protein